MEYSIAGRHSIVSWQQGTLHFQRNDGTLGWQQLAFHLRVDGRLFDSRRHEWHGLPSTSDRLVLVSRPADLPLEVTVSLTLDAAADRLMLRCRYRNRTSRTLRISDIYEGDGTLLCPNGRAFHVENIKRMFGDAAKRPVPKDRRLAWGTVLCGQDYWAQLGPELVYGRSEDQPYPALFLASPSRNGGVVDAQFSQDRWYREVSVTGTENTTTFNYRAAMTTRGVSSVKIPPNTAIDGEMTWFQLTPHTDLTRAFAPYNEALLSHYDFRAVNSPNRNEYIWGSWNLGIWKDVSDDLVVENARIIKEHFPRVRWVQIDDGWSALPTAAVAAPLRNGADHEKFPRGLAAVAADVKDIGLRPALWCGMTLPKDNPLFFEHPEWLLQNEDGSPHTTWKCVLDVSREDVREFLTRTYRRIIRDWGFEGIKLDFWSYGFEDHGMVYQNDDHTSLELRNWWLKTLRDLLPEDGYLQPGCNVCSISPFVARWVDNIRYGVDVGEGDDWQAAMDSATWLAAFSLCEPSRMWLPNSDAIGSMKRMDPARRRSWLSFCAVTGSALELGADLRKEEPADWVDAQRILAGLQPNHAFKPLDFGAPDGPNPPTLWFSKGGVHDGNDASYAGMFCAFNWNGDGASQTRVPFTELGLSDTTYRVVNFWTEEESVRTDTIEIPRVESHDVYAVQLFAVE
ncbi:MAG: alpha-galactosidase [Candidatus Pacebacteria bacterium]|nr:alpha-galactosidase [Candidatus Paceibacterota bacterium]